MKKALIYKEYIAKIDFDVEDMLLVGQVIGIADSLYFHAQSASEIEEMFHQCVDNYLEFCAEVGKDPEKSYKGSFNVRVSEDLHRRADFAAVSRGITLNQFVVSALQHELDGPQKEMVYIAMPQPFMEAMLNTGASQATNFRPAIPAMTNEKGVSDLWQVALN